MSLPKSLWIPVGAVSFSLGTLLAIVALTFNIGQDDITISWGYGAWLLFTIAFILILAGAGCSIYVCVD